MVKVYAFVVTALLCLGMLSSAWAAGWKPYEFPPEDHFYKYRIVHVEGEETTEWMYSIDVKKVKSKFRVTTSWSTETDELGQDLLFGQWGLNAGMMMLAFLNPLYVMGFAGEDLKVGENYVIPYAPISIKCDKKVKVAGLEGFHLTMTDKETKKVTMEAVIDPNVPLPLSTRSIDDGDVWSSELIEYR